MESLKIDVESIRLEREREIQREIEENFAAPGALGLPALLEKKRIQYAIPDAAWADAAIFNKVLVWQIPIDDRKTYGNSTLVKTEQTLKREQTEAPRGVIVSAGLQALDELRSHGVDIGHTVYFTHLAPFRKRLPMIAGRESSVIILHAGDIFASQELAESLKSRKCRVITREQDGAISHVFCDENGKTWNPAQGVSSEDG